MPTTISSITDAVDVLPPAAVLAVEDVTWEEYEQVSEALEERPSVRVTYDQGRLEIVTTSHAHDKRNRFVGRLLHVLCEELDLDLESIGSTTEKRKRDLKGTEPDSSFYVGDVERVVGKEELNLETDSPPDLVVEIDKSNQSLRKFPIYATFGVPEIWRYLVRQKRAEIYELRDKEYVEISSSRFFPILTSADLARFIEQSATQGQTAAIKAFRRWLKTKLR